MSIITVEELRELVETDLSDEALQIEIDAAEQAILRVAGSLDDVTEEREGHSEYVILARHAAEITTVSDDDGETELTETDDWILLSDRRSLRRVGARWRHRVQVAYTPADELALRQMVIVQLVRHAITGTPGVIGFTEGNWSIQFASGETWSAARQGVLDGVGLPWHFG